MALTQNERDLITASPDGANKLVQLDRMVEANLDNRFLGEALTQEVGESQQDFDARKAQQRNKFVMRIVGYNDADLVRAVVNLDSPWFDGTNMVVSADSDYTALERGVLVFFATKLRNRNQNIVIPRHAVWAISRFTGADAALSAIAPGATAVQRRNFLQYILD